MVVDIRSRRRNIRGVVDVALDTAVTWVLLKTNPANKIKLPKVPKRQAKALDFSQARTLLESSSDHWLADFLVVDMAPGARRGEMLGLAWPDVGAGCCSVTIRTSLEQTDKRRCA